MPKPWLNQMDPPKPGFFRKRRSQGCIKVAYAESHLYIIHHNYNISTNVLIESYPFTDPTAPPSPNHQIFKGPDNFLSSYFFTGTRDGITFLGGLGQDNNTITVTSEQTLIFFSVHKIFACLLSFTTFSFTPKNITCFLFCFKTNNVGTRLHVVHHGYS